MPKLLVYVSIWKFYEGQAAKENDTDGGHIRKAEIKIPFFSYIYCNLKIKKTLICFTPFAVTP